MLPHLSEDDVYKFILFVGKIHHQNKFQPVLRDIEDGTMCVLKMVNFCRLRQFGLPVSEAKLIMQRWNERIGAGYHTSGERYEGASRYLFPNRLIRSSKKLKAQGKRCKYYTFNELAEYLKNKHVLSGTKYVMKHIKKKIRVSGKAKCFDNYFHRK